MTRVNVWYLSVRLRAAALDVRGSDARGGPTRLGCRDQALDDLGVQGPELALHEPADERAVPGSRPMDPSPLSGRCDAHLGAVVADRHPLHHAVDEPSWRVDFLHPLQDGRAPQPPTAQRPHPAGRLVTLALVASHAPRPPAAVALGVREQRPKDLRGGTRPALRFHVQLRHLQALLCTIWYMNQTVQ